MVKLWNKKIWLPLAGLVFLAQLFVPAYMIFEQKQTLSKGVLYKFQVRPIDPYDPFRGRYVVLSFDADRAAKPVIDLDDESKKLPHDSWIYASLTNDDDGFAKVQHLTLEPSNGEADYLRVKVKYNQKENLYSFDIPFDRYYSPENKAYAIETNVRSRSRRNEDKVYVAVKIYKGKGTIEDLFINETPILDFVEELQKTEQKN